MESCCCAVSVPAVSSDETLEGPRYLFGDFRSQPAKSKSYGAGKRAPLCPKRLFRAAGGKFARHQAATCRTMLIRAAGDYLRAGEYVRAAGLNWCGDVWCCPTCSRLITARRRSELLAGMASWSKISAGAGNGCVVQLLTLTIPHYAGDRLADSRRAFRAAQKLLRGHRIFRDALKSVGSVGSASAMELTYGHANGWHVHTHALVFAQSALSSDALAQLRLLWLRILRKHSLAAFTSDAAILEHGLDVQNGDKAGAYLAKFGKAPSEWSAADELTSSHFKKGTMDRLTPFQILELANGGDEKYKALWLEYCEAMKGEKQLVWSKGLKKLLGIADLSDEEIAAAAGEAPRDNEESICQFTPDQRAVIVHRELEDEALAFVDSISRLAPRSDWQRLFDEWVAAMRSFPKLNDDPVFYPVWRGDTSPNLSARLARGDALKPRYWRVTSDD